MNATIRDVAKKAKVGVGTVSRVLNNSAAVSEATRQAVLEAIQALNFVPNTQARRLSLGKTSTIGIIASFFTRPSVVERLRGIEHISAQTTYDLTIFNVEHVGRSDHFFRTLGRGERVDGLIVVSLKVSDEAAELLSHAPIPVVLVDFAHPNFSYVTINDVDGGRQATQHLIDLGHTHIAFLSDHFDYALGNGSSYDRFMGYQQALAEAQIPFRPEYQIQGSYGRAAAQEMARHLLSLPTPPTAIFAASDTQAFGVLEAAEQLGVQVPHQLSVVGYDDIEIAEFLNLTTIRQPLFETGQKGIEFLFQLIEQPNLPSPQAILPTQLVQRGTTGRGGSRE
jgi:DNA-binding LacI/PurR family transcriptional regulator